MYWTIVVVLAALLQNGGNGQEHVHTTHTIIVVRQASIDAAIGFNVPHVWDRTHRL
jgi:hypothetical protein